MRGTPEKWKKDARMNLGLKTKWLFEIFC
jgi:hypothetical protein